MKSATPEAEWRQLRGTMREGDPRDADVLLDFLMKHRGHLRAWRPDTAQTRELQFLVEDRRQLVDEKTRCLNRRTQRLKLLAGTHPLP